MASTYVNDLRLNEMATGDESGNWGVVTNLNLELIGEALGYGTEGITTNADTHTTTVADGATDPGRAMYIEYTGTLDSACTITIAPNTLNRMHFIENGTSGSQNIIISQGSGANITIPPGDTKAVYLDGAGSGAAVVDAFASLSVVDLKVQDDLTVTDDLIVGGDIDLEGAIDVNGTANLDVVDIDGAVDMASTLQVDGAITSSAGATITTADNLDTLSLISTDADASVGPNLRLYRNSGSPADSDALGRIQAVGRNDNSQDVIYSTIETFALDVSDGTEDAVLNFNVMQGGSSVSFFKGNNTEVVVNDDSKDLDFRVESDNLTHALFLQGSDGRVGIGTDSPDAILEVVDAGAAAPGTALKVYSNQNSAATDGLVFIHSDQDVAPFTALNVRQDGTGDILNLLDGTTEVFTVLNGGNVGIGEAAPHERLHVTGPSGNTLLLHMDADTADGTNALLFKNDSTNTDVRIKGGIIFQRDDPGTRGTGDLHICVNGVNSDTNVSVTDSKMAFYASGESAITGGTFYVSGEGNAFSAGSHNGMQFAINGQSVSSRAASNLQTHKSFYNSNGSVGSITTNASATAFNTSSDYRLKENVVTDWDGTTLLKQLKPSKFNFKADADTTVQGFLAHEVSSIVPQAVAGEKDAVYTAEEEADGEGVEGQPNYQGIDHSKLVPLLVKSIQELESRITTLEG